MAAERRVADVADSRFGSQSPPPPPPMTAKRKIHAEDEAGDDPNEYLDVHPSLLDSSVWLIKVKATRVVCYPVARTPLAS